MALTQYQKNKMKKEIRNKLLEFKKTGKPMKKPMKKKVVKEKP